MSKRKILVLARRNHAEAMRVASGLTIFDHHVRLVFMTEPVAETPENLEQAELLEMSGIEPETTVDAMADELKLLNAEDLALAMTDTDFSINL